MEKNRRRGLGRGLSALLQDEAPEPALSEGRRGSREVPVEWLRPSAAQPRRRFDAAELEELAASIRANGVLQPVLVRRLDQLGRAYEIVAGERRWRAAQVAGLHAIPVVVREVSDAEALQLALIENLQRQDLTALEEAEGYRHLVDDHGQTQEAVAQAVGRSRSHVANTLRLLGLPEEVREMLQDGRLSAGHARALVGREDAAALAQRILARGLNVRQAEQLTRPPRAAKAMAETPPADANTRAWEGELSQALGLKVELIDRGGAGGEVRVHYKTLEQLDEVEKRLRRGEASFWD